MSKRQAAWSDATRGGGRGPGLGGAALALLVLAWTGAPGDLRADTIVLKSGEVLEGSIIDATRNTVIVQPAIGGMRQMSLRAIAEVRIGLARGQSISGQLLSWADGVYQVRSGGQVVRVSEGNVLSREPGAAASGAPQRTSPSPAGPQTVRRAAAPAQVEETAPARATSARQQPAAQGREGDDQEQSPAAAQDQRLAEGEKQSPAAGQEESKAPGEDLASATDQEPSRAGDDDRNRATDGERSLAEGAKQSPAAGQDPGPVREARARVTEAEQSPGQDGDPSPSGAERRRSAAAGEDQSRATGQEQTLAAVGKDQAPAPDERQSLAVNASVDPAEAGAANMVFKIELSRPAEQTVVLIYGTVEGTAKAGEDFEPQQGVVTLAPGTQSAEVRVPLIEQPASEGEKRFELFLAADPKVAEVVDKRIVATINGGD